ncbi:MAG: hypothetical protein IPN70_03950 [Candidatus Moraniibacteriota bacterium]|nr:MAG: hypothetical protein IPN70_03950 [Candidatus Moranbacteria bacterium]
MEEKQNIVILAHNIRSAHNIGALFRTADGFGVSKIFLSGYSPVPYKENSLYKNKGQKEIEKTALGAEKNIPWEYFSKLSSVLERIHKEGFFLVALEQSPKSIPFHNEIIRKKTQLAILLGNEVLGVHGKTLKKMDAICEIPMRGKKNSFNVIIACAVFLGAIRYFDKDS